MKKNLKRAFTIVELVIVIAVIAILAAVLIPTFVNVTKNAKKSADMHAVQQMNEALAINAAQNEKPNSVEEARAALTAAGINADTYAPMDSNNILYYDLTENKILILDQSTQKVTFPEDLAKKYPDDYSGSKPQNWYPLNENMLETVTLGENESLSDAISGSTATQKIKLTKSQTISTGSVGNYSFPNNESGTVNIDLNGNTLTFDSSTTTACNIDLVANQTVTISNGKVSSKGQFNVPDYAALTLENVEFTSTKDAIFPCGSGSVVDLTDSTITANGAWGIATNANGELSNAVVINIEGSTITTKNGPGLFVNVRCQVSVKDSTITGDGIGVCIRGGSATFENCNIAETGDNSWANDYAVGENKEFSLYNGAPFTNGWGSGNMVQYGGLIVGDWSNSYSYDASCTLINTKVTVNDTVAFPTVYLSQDEGYTTTLNYDAQSTVGTVVINSATNLTRGTIIVNGTVQ